MTTAVRKPSCGHGAFNNRNQPAEHGYEREITHREECGNKADRPALRSPMDMKEKSPIEKNAEIKQIDLLSEALNSAPNANGYWMNASGKGYPKFYPHGVSVSPFNGLFMALHSDRNGCRTNLFALFNEARAMGASVLDHEQGVSTGTIRRKSSAARPISDWTNRTGNITRACITGKCAPCST